MRTRHLFVPFLGAMMASAPFIVDAAPAPQGGAPVLIDFRATTEAGEPILDLKPADVTLRVGGKPREVRSLELVTVGGTATATPVGPVRAPFVTNASSGAGPRSREILIVLDEDSIAPGREQVIRGGVTQLLAGLTPRDRVGVVATRQGGTHVEFTPQHDKIREAIGRFSGHGTPNETETDFVCRTVVALETVRSALSSFSPDAAPTLVFMSAALSAPQPERTVQVGRGSDLCQLRTRDFEEIGALAQNAHTNMYVVHALESAGSKLPNQTLQAGLDSLAGVTGAETIRITGGSETTLARIARETSAFYLASFDPEPGERGGRHRVELRVARDRARVNARPNVAIGRADGAAAGKPLTPRDMMVVSTTFRDLPLRAAAFAARNPKGTEPQLLVLYEPVDPSTKLKAAAAGLYDQKGTLKIQSTASGDDLARTPVMSMLVGPAGTYRLRVAATDTAGRSGTVDTDVQVGLTPAGPYQISGLLLGAPSAQSPFLPKLQFGPADTQVIAYLEVYGVKKGANVAVTLELAETEDGPSAAGGNVPLADGPLEDVKVARPAFNIAQLPPGDVVVRMIVNADGKPVARVMRTLRKTK